MKKLILTTLLLSSTIASAQGNEITLECTRAKTTQIVRIDLIDDSKPTSDESETLVKRIQRQISPTDKMISFASGKSISSDGSLDGLDLDVRALSRMTGPKEACYKMGSEMNLDLVSIIGGKGAGGVYIFDVQERPRIKLKDKNDTTCSIPKVMPPKPYKLACRQIVESTETVE